MQISILVLILVVLALQVIIGLNLGRLLLSFEFERQRRAVKEAFFHGEAALMTIIQVGTRAGLKRKGRTRRPAQSDS